MTEFEHLIHAPAVNAAGWALFHSLWQGALAALILLALMLVTRSPRVRYACACTALILVPAAFVLTCCLLLSRTADGAGATPQVILSAPRATSPYAPPTPARFRFEDALPWLVPFWIAGVAVFHLRAVAAWLSAQRLRARGVCLAPDPWPRRMRELAARLRITRPVALFETCLGDVPVVIGWLRPVILVPVAMFAGMPIAYVETILLHELAHIRRRDYFLNLLQTILEGFFFYHPAVWWISVVIRAEREHCCDDIVVEATGDRREYAAALTALEQTRRAEATVLAASGGYLVKRIRRILYPREGFASNPLLSAGILTLILAGAVVAWQAATPSQNQRAAGTPPQASPYIKWLQEDVAYIINDRERVIYKGLRTDEERDQFIKEFWLHRDPTPGTPENEFKDEHFRRIGYANQRFTWRSVPGWKTDRGRMYIVFGPPDELESHPTGRPAGPGVTATDYPVEQWLYHHIKDVGDNVIMEFDDQAKNGDFRMTKDPNPGAASKFVPGN